MILQLNPPIPLQTLKGPGLAHFIDDQGIESESFWVVFLNTGQIWWFPNSQVRACENFTVGRVKNEELK
jgi:hypothetical protein